MTALTAAPPRPALVTRTPWRRMARYLFEAAKTHPVLDQLRTEGERPILNAHERAVWIALCPKIAAGGWNVEAKVERPEWWRPVTQAHGNELLDELAAEAVRLRVEFLSRRPTPSPSANRARVAF